MVRWISFDDETAEAVVTRFKRGASEIQHGDPLDAALTLGRSSLLLLPATTPERVLVARVEPPAEAALLRKPMAAEPSTPLPPTPIASRKKWWQKRTA